MVLCLVRAGIEASGLRECMAAPAEETRETNPAKEMAISSAGAARPSQEWVVESVYAMSRHRCQVKLSSDGK
jgi:hypothetical protein